MHTIRSLLKPFNAGSVGMTATLAIAKWSMAGLLALSSLLTFSTVAEAATPSVIHAVGIENQYADVIQQIGGKYVDASSLISNPNTDPHTFEASPSVARQLSQAELIVRNGAGYDDWASKLIKATASSNTKVIDVQHLLNLPDDTWNPHLWYDVKTMPAVADQIAKDLAAIRPEQTKYFQNNAEKFKQSLNPWYQAIDQFKHDYPKATAAVTEPVSDYLLNAMGINIQTPHSLQTSVMNGVDPSPQDVSTQNSLLNQHNVNVFVYNQQVTNSLTSAFLSAAHNGNIPVVSVYETMPTGFHYQSWMLAETKALQKALANHASTEHLTSTH